VASWALSAQSLEMNRADELPRTVSDAVPRRFTAGDALRGVAAMFVLVFHAAVETMLFKHTPGFVLGSDSPHSFSPIFGRLAPEFIAMRFGVFIFFALSGYLLTRTFLAAFTLGTQPRAADHPGVLGGDDRLRGVGPRGRPVGRRRAARHLRVRPELSLERSRRSDASGLDARHRGRLLRGDTARLAPRAGRWRAHPGKATIAPRDRP